MNDNIFDLYVDYLLGSFGMAAAAGLSDIPGGQISHDRITRMLSAGQKTSADLWRIAKPSVRQIESPDGVLIIDGSISEKPPTDENGIICWHYDHCQGRRIKGINFMTALYHSRNASLPAGFQIIAETGYQTGPKDGKTERRCPVPENRYCREMIKQAAANQIMFCYVLTDIWSASAENMMFVRHDVRKDFVMPVKTNRKIAMSYDDRQQGRYVRTDTAVPRTDTPTGIFMENIDFPMLSVRQVFENKDGSRGIPHSVTSDTALAYEQITAIYRKRWNVECYHKPLRQNVCPEKSPTQTVRTQTNHFSASLCGYIKPEMFRISDGMNRFALKTKIYINALSFAFSELQKLQLMKVCA